MLCESEARLSLDVGTPGEHAGEHASSVPGAWARRAGSTIAWGWAALRGAAHTAWSAAGGVARPICSAPYGPSAEAKSARLTSWRATAARTVRVCAHLPRAFMHPGLGACVPCGASCSGGPALAYPISDGGASCLRPVPAVSRSDGGISMHRLPEIVHGGLLGGQNGNDKDDKSPNSTSGRVQ